MKVSGRSSSIQITFIWIRILPPPIARKGNFAEAIALYTKAQEATHLPSSGLAITYARMGRQTEARNILAQLLQAREKRYVSAPVIAAVYVGAWRQRRSFPLARTRLCRALGNTTVDRVSSRISSAPFRRTFPSSSTANRRFAELNFGDHRDNSVRDYRSERPESPDPQSWSKATTRYAKWPRCKNYRLLLRPNER